MPNVSVSTVDELVTALIDAQSAISLTTITLMSSNFNLSSYSGGAFGDQDWKKSALPHITKEVVIQPHSSVGRATITRDEFGAAYRHFFITATGELTLLNINLVNGDVGLVDSGGGAISNDGILIARHCMFTNNTSNYGGAILNFSGDVTLEFCDLEGNQADWGGALYNGNNPGCQMTITNSRIAENHANESFKTGGGIANFGALTIDHCFIGANTALTGGAIAAYGNTATIQNSIIRSNHADAGGTFFADGPGQISVACSTITSNTANTNSPVGRIEDTGIISIANCWLPEYNPNDATSRQTVIGNFATATNPSNPLPPRYPAFEMQVDVATNNLIPSYQYNRQEAARYAINESRDNFDIFPRGNGNLTATVDGNVGGLFTYPQSILDHEGIKTGSAIFISECLFVGGLPMVYGLNSSNQIDFAGCDQATDPDTNRWGWHICPNSSLGATQSWKGHQSLIAYLISKGGYLIESLPEAEVDQYINYTTGQVEDAQSIYDLFGENGLYRDVQTGDYVFIDQGSLGGHGFLIVGWGPCANIQESVNAALDGEPNSAPRVTFYLEKPTGPPVPVVPYVVDFAYGYNSSENKTGWLQDVRPRPFYVSAANNALSSFNPNIVGYPIDDATDNDYESRLRGNFGAFVYEDAATGCVDTTQASNPCRPNWQFYHVPDTIRVDPERIYHYPCSV